MQIQPRLGGERTGQSIGEPGADQLASPPCDHLLAPSIALGS